MVSGRSFHRQQHGFTLIELLVVISILGVMGSLAIPHLSGFLNEGAEESKSAERANLQTAVTALLGAAKQPQLNSSYTAVDTQTEISQVMAGTERLDDYILGLPYPLKQPYDIGQSGEVSVSSGD